VLDGVSIYPVADPLKKDGPAFADYDPRISPPAWKSFARRFIFPDRFVKWRKMAETHLAEECEQIDADIVLASFPPASVATLGVAAARLLNIPLVLDYRDRWLGEGGYAPESPKQRAKHEALERDCVRAASGITTVSENMALRNNTVRCLWLGTCVLSPATSIISTASRCLSISCKTVASRSS